MAYEQQTTWICDRCGKREQKDGLPPGWWDVDNANLYREEGEFEDYEFCSWECVGLFALSRVPNSNITRGKNSAMNGETFTWRRS